MRGQFTFYRSYYEAVKSMKKTDAAALLLAVCAYALDGEEIPLSGAARAAFCLIKPTLDSGRKKAEERERRKAEKRASAEESDPQADGENAESNGQREAQKREITRTVGDKKKDSGRKNSGQWETKSGNEREGERENKKEYESERDRELERDVDDEEEIERDYHWVRTQQATPTAAAPDASVTGFDGADLSAEMEANRQAQAFIRRYGLADTEATLAALMEDIGSRGIDAVRAALDDAAASDTRGGISVRYYRAILANQGKARPTQTQGAVAAQDGSNNPFVILARRYGAAEGGDAT